MDTLVDEDFIFATEVVSPTESDAGLRKGARFKADLPDRGLSSDGDKTVRLIGFTDDSEDGLLSPCTANKTEPRKHAKAQPPILLWERSLDISRLITCLSRVSLQPTHAPSRFTVTAVHNTRDSSFDDHATFMTL